MGALTAFDTSKLTSSALSTPGTYTLKATAPALSNSLLPISASFFARRTVLAALI